MASNKFVQVGNIGKKRCDLTLITIILGPETIDYIKKIFSKNQRLHFMKPITVNNSGCIVVGLWMVSYGNLS